MSSIQSFYFVGVITLVSSAHVYGQKKDKMNVLFIIADDMRPELGCYGIEDIVTPHIDRLAEQATVFQNAYCNIPVSGASRASLFTGVYPCYPERFTAFDANAEKDCPKALSLPECFKKNGYYVISNGKVFHNITDHARSWSEYPWRVYPDGYGKDWAEYNKWELWQNEESSRYIHPKTLRGPFCESADVSDTTYIDGRVAQKTIADLRRLKEMKVPFFLACGFWKPHLPFNAPKKYWDLYQREKIQLASNPYRPKALPKQVTSSGEIRGYGKFTTTKDEAFQREAKHGYYACVSYIDAQIGLVLDELERLGLAESTIVVILGDHGWHLGDHGLWNKHTNFEQATHVPFLLIDPSSPAQKVTTPVEFLSIYPTLCDLAGLKKPLNLDGESLVEVVKGKKDVVNIKPYAVSQYPRVGKMGYSLRDGRYRYTVWLNWKDKKTDTTKILAEELYDYAKDPDETVNVAANSDYADALQQMKRYWEEYKKTRIVRNEK